jgi:hypothetical protein
MFRGSHILSLLVVLASGCASTSRFTALPPERQQPRMAELLVYLEYRGVENASRTPVYEFSHWAMYQDVAWDGEPRKPRFEAATVAYRSGRTLLAIVPVTRTPQQQELVRTSRAKDGKPVGATLTPAGRRWSVGFTLAEPDERAQRELEELLAGFIKQQTGGPDARATH